MTITSQEATELGAIVREANECAEQLLNVLEEERDALSAGNVTGIDSCGQKKTGFVARLECLDRERIAMCQVFTISDRDIDAFLIDHNACDDNCSWQQFLIQLRKCREANDVNGRITHLRRQHLERSLEILRGCAENNPGLYGPNGFDNIKNAGNLGQA